MNSYKIPSSQSHFSSHNCILADVHLNITNATFIMGLKIHYIYSTCSFSSAKSPHGVQE